MSRYADLYHLPHHVSKKRMQMSVHDRAAQFAPFAALTGYDAVIVEAGRWTETPILLADGAAEELNLALRELEARIKERPNIALTYFCPDRKKSGGAVLCITGTPKKLDAYQKRLVLEDDTEIPIGDLLQLRFLEPGDIL